MIVRIRSPDGTARFDLAESEPVDTLIAKIAESAPSLDPDTLAISNQPRGGETSLETLRGRTLGDLGIKHGDLLFASSAPRTSAPAPAAAPTAAAASPAATPSAAGAKPWQAIDEAPVDVYWSKKDGRIGRTGKDAPSRHKGNLNTLAIEPYDTNYHKEHQIKHLSFHAYLRKLHDKNPPTSSVASLPPLSEPSFKYMQWVPAAITLGVQEFRMVDHVEFSSPAMIENLLNFWRATATQRFGFLLGRYEPYDKVPMGIKAVVEAIHEPPQEGELDGLTLGLPWEDQARVEALARDAGLEVVGMIYTDLTQAPGESAPQCKRHQDSFFLSSLETCFAAKLQLANPTRTRHSPTGTFQSRFVTCVLSGTPEGGVDVAAYQVSAQGAALVDADIVEPSVEPGTMRLRESVKGRYVPDVFYRYKNKYGIDVKQYAKPCFPVEYLLVNLTHGFPVEPNPLFLSSRFPIENRPGLHDQSVDKLVSLLSPLVKDLPGVAYLSPEDVGVSSSSGKGKGRTEDAGRVEELRRVLSDWHLVAWLEESGLFSKDDVKKFMHVATAHDDPHALEGVVSTDGWKTLMHIVKERSAPTAQPHDYPGAFGGGDDVDIPPEAFDSAAAGGGAGGLSDEDEAAIQSLMAFGGFPYESAKEAYLACDRNSEHAANLLFENAF